MSRNFSRRNYSEALDKLVPQIYNEEDLKLASEKQDLPSKILDADADLGGLMGANTLLNVELQALEQRNLARTISNPKVRSLR